MAYIDHTNYQSKFDKYDSTIVGKAVISINSPTVIGLGYPLLGKGMQFDENDIRVGYLTGYWTTVNGTIYTAVEFETLMGADNLGYYQFGYVVPANYRTYTFGEKADAKSMIDELIKNNQIIADNNLICAKLISFCEKSGIAVSKEERSQLYALQSRLVIRNNKLINSSFLKTTTGQSVFSPFTTDLSNFMSSPGINGISQIGVAPVVIYVISALIIGALTSYIVFNSFKNDHAESKADVKYSDEMMTILKEKLTPKELEMFLGETGVIQDNVNAAIKKAASSNSLKSTLKTISYAGAGLLGFMLLSNVFANTSKTNYYSRASRAIK